MKLIHTHVDVNSKMHLTVIPTLYNKLGNKNLYRN